MFAFFSSSDPKEKAIMDTILTDTQTENPFPGRPATATPENPPTKLLGRDNEKKELESIILKTATTDDRPLIIIQGETGMGKSALTSHIFNEIRQGGLNKDNVHIYATFIEAYGEVRDFRLKSFFSQIMKSLDKYDQLPKIVARMVQFIGKTILETDPGGFTNIFKSWNPSEHVNTTIQRLNDYKRAQEFVDAILAGISIYLGTLKKKWMSLDTTIVSVLLLSQSATKERIKALEALKSGGKYDSFSVATDADAKQFLNAFMDLLVAINPNSAMVIFIDQLEELFDIEEPKKISMKIFTMLLTLRQIPKLSIVLSGNNQAYKHLLDNLQGDAKEQIEHWHKFLYIPRLETDNVVHIVYELLAAFWRNHELNPDPKFPYYPLSDKTIAYLYEKNDRNLRRTLINLHDIFNSFKEKQQVADLSDPIKAIGDLQIIQDPTKLPLQIQRDFYEYITSENIQDKDRARIPEEALYKLLLVLQQNTDFISELEMSPKMPKSGKKPDIYYRLGGNLYHHDSRKIGIEVKCYRRGTIIDRGNVEKTVELLAKKDLDYVIWVTNVPLHSETIDNLPSEIKQKQISIAPKTNQQLAYLYWAYIFEQAFQRMPKPDEAYTLLERIGVPKIFVSEPETLIENERQSETGTKIITTIPDIFEYSQPPVGLGIDFQDKVKELKTLFEKG